jgi:hypothetical protein
MKLLALFLLLLAPEPQRVGAPLPTRPRDPWVFRSVLDKHMRMITIALHEDMWVAYDARTCALYRMWKGGVNFTGSVYDTVHGPQPTVRGADYSRGVDGPAWFAFASDKPIDVTPRYQSYLFEAGHVVLRWELELADGRKLHVAEGLEFVRPEDLGFPDERLEELGLTKGDPGLWRSFRLLDATDDVKLDVFVDTSGTRGPKLADYAERERIEDVKDAKGEFVGTRILSHLPLTKARPHNQVRLFYEPRVLPAEKDKNAAGAKDDAAGSTKGGR